MDFKNKEFASTCAFAIGRAVAETKENSFEFLCVDLIVLNILEATPMGEAFVKKMNIDIVDLRKLVMEFLSSSIPRVNENDYEPIFSDGTQSLLQNAYVAKKAIDKNALVSGLDIVLSLFSSQNTYDSFIRNHLINNNITAEKVANYVSAITGNRAGDNTDLLSKSDKAEKKTFLDKFTVNLNEMAKEGKISRLQGRDGVLSSLVITLGQKHKSCPLVVGEMGVGKTAIVEGLARAIELNEPFIDGVGIPEAVKEFQILRVDITTMMAGTKFRGDFEDRMNGLAQEALKDKNIVLFFDELKNLVNLGSTSGSCDAVNILKPYIESHGLKVIGTVNVKDYRSIVEKSALARLFKVISVEPATKDHTFNILKGLQSGLEEHHKVRFTDSSIKEVINLTDKFLTNLNFPDKAISVMDMALSKAYVFGKKEVELTDIREIMASEYNVPVNALGDLDELERIRGLSSSLKSSVFGQDKAINKISDYIVMNRAQLTLKDKPLASFLLAGPTGVGKTEVCKQLSKELNIPLIRFDMSEYKEKHSVAKLIGGPPGYIGYEDGGLLIEAINKNPNSVLLLDEIEKAHPEVLDVLLQIMDYAILTDSSGRKANFKNVAIFMTSNLGHSEVSESIGFSSAFSETDTTRIEVIKNYFRPEFINRLDGIVMFKAIEYEIAEKIANKQLSQITERLKERNISLDFDKTVLDYVVANGFDEKMGGRNIERFVESKILQPLSYQVLFNSLEGNSITVTLSDEGLKFIKQESIPEKKVKVSTKKTSVTKTEKPLSKKPKKETVKT